MKKNSVFVKSLGCAFLTTAVAGGIAFALYPKNYNEQKIDFSAFKNFSQNLNAIASAEASSEEANLAAQDKLTARIIAQIDSEVKAKINHSRIALKAIQKIAIKKPVVNQLKAKNVVAKNWNDIRPVFKTVEYKNIEIKALKTDEESMMINNQELIKLYAFQADPVQTYAFSSLSWKLEVETATTEVAVNTQDVVKDEVSNTMASLETDDTSDMVMYEYSAAGAADHNSAESEYSNPSRTEAQKPAKMFDSPLSKSVKAAIARELNKSPAIETVVPQAQPRNKIKEVIEDEASLDAIMENEDNIVYDYSVQKSSSTKESNAASFAGDIEDQAQEKEFVIKAQEVNLSTQKVRTAVAFEFVPDYDRTERIDDSANGEIKIGYSLSGDVNTQTGVIQSQGMIPTRVELNLAEDGMSIPLINEEGIQKFLMKRKLDIQGNLALFAIDSGIKDIEIDSSYAAKMFFNKQFKNVDTQNAADYVMFLGVQTGNTLIRYHLSNKESSQKIVYMGDGEMYFEDAQFASSVREIFTLTTRSLLGKKVKELNVDASLIGVVGSPVKAKKKALNAYELKIPEMISGSRKYLEFKHLPATIYVGTDSQNEIEVPGMDFIRKVLEANQIDELGERCIVQLNLEKDLRSIKVSGKNKAGEMFTETSFLDTDGNFTTENSELAEKAFIVGDLEGQFSAKLEYSDGSTQFLKTFCSQGSYLIEQL